MTTSTDLPPVHSRTSVVLAVAFALVCGAGIATQARINGELSRQLGDGALAALISFATGLVVVAVVMLFAPSGRRGLATLRTELVARRTPWWYVAGGVAGAFLVFSQGLVAAVLGVALFSVAVVAGQALSGLIIDGKGLGTMLPKPVTARRVVGSVLAVGAVLFVGSTQFTGEAPVWMLVFPFIAGFGIGWQQAVNGQVRAVSGSAITATFVNFVVGTAVLLTAVLLHSIWVGWPSALPTDPILYLGGLVGVVFIAAAAVIVRITGVLLLGLATIAGQLVASIVLDLVAPIPGHQLAVTTVVGTLLTLVAVGIAAVPARKAQPKEAQSSVR